MSLFRKMIMMVLITVFFFIVPALLLLRLGEHEKKQRIDTLEKEFIQDATKDGVLTENEYLIFADAIARLGGYDIILEHTSYVKEVSYEISTEEKLEEYFRGRNILTQNYVPVYPVELQAVDPEHLVLQKETNASVFSALESGGYIPLPDDEATNVLTYESVRPVQECYSGETLVTVVKVSDNGWYYYVEADPLLVTGTGTSVVTLSIAGEPISATVSVSVYPKTYICTNGHEMAFTEEKLVHWKATGDYGACESCASVPTMIKADRPLVTAEVGTEWSALPVSLSVLFLDGHEENLLLEDSELFVNYDKNYCGTQNVTVSYKGAVSQCFEVFLHGKRCAVCGGICEERSLVDYQRFNYCNQCLAGTPFYFGDTYTQKYEMSNDDIIDRLTDQGMYYFERGDYFTVSVYYMEKSILSYQGSEFPVVNGGHMRTRGRK